MSKAFVTVAVLSVLSLSDVALGRILWAKRGAKPEFFHPRRFVQEHPRAIDLSIRAGNIGNFGSCSIPQIKFGAGFDGRKETSFEPNDQSQYCGIISLSSTLITIVLQHHTLTAPLKTLILSRNLCVMSLLTPAVQTSKRRQPASQRQQRLINRPQRQVDKPMRLIMVSVSLPTLAPSPPLTIRVIQSMVAQRLPKLLLRRNPPLPTSPSAQHRPVSVMEIQSTVAQ
jgi:hypothetical protein